MDKLHALAIPEALPVVIQLNNTALDSFLKNLGMAREKCRLYVIPSQIHSH